MVSRVLEVWSFRFRFLPFLFAFACFPLVVCVFFV